MKSSFGMKFDGSIYAVGKDARLVNLGPIVLFSSYNLTTGSGKHLEDISHARFVSLLQKKNKRPLKSLKWQSQK